MPKICGEPIEEIDAMYAVTEDDGVIVYPKSTQVMCMDGYTTGGDRGGRTDFVVKCTKRCEFENFDKRNCQPVRCGAAPIMSNASLSGIETPDSEPSKQGHTASYYKLKGKPKNLPNLNRLDPSKINVHFNNINDGSMKMGEFKDWALDRAAHRGKIGQPNRVLYYRQAQVVVKISPLRQSSNLL